MTEIGEAEKAAARQEERVSLVRLRSFACDDMHSRAIDSQSGFRFLFFKDEKVGEGLGSCCHAKNRYENTESMFLTF